MTPSRAHASIATMASGTIGMYIATRSPATTPRSVSTLAALHTPASRSEYVSVRLSPTGSPSHWMATRSPLPASTWRSTQLYATLSLPPTNHLANGASDQSSTSVNGVSQDNRLACFSQNASRSFSAASYSSAVALALRANSVVGGYADGASVCVTVILVCVTVIM